MHLWNEMLPVFGRHLQEDLKLGQQVLESLPETGLELTIDVIRMQQRDTDVTKSRHKAPHHVTPSSGVSIKVVQMNRELISPFSFLKVDATCRSPEFMPASNGANASGNEASRKVQTR
jgi:hypothetical protein